MMPPLLALILCTVIVLYLLRLESRMSRTVSAVSWIPTFWMLMIASRSLGAWFGTVGNNDSGSWMDQFALSGLIVLGITVVFRRNINWRETLNRNQWLLVLIGYMLLSTFWSEITFIAIKRWIREVIAVIMGLVLLSEANPREALTVLFRRTAYVLLPFSIVLIKYYPELGRQYGRWSGLEMWTGVTSQKNQLGRVCMLSIFFLGWALFHGNGERRRAAGRIAVWADVVIIVLAAYLMWGANSSTSLGTLIVGIATYLGLRWLRKTKVKVPKIALVALVLFLISFGASAPFLGGSNVADFSSALGRDDTLTGRTEVWAAVLPAFEQRPITGYGFGSFWTDARRELYDIPTAHNGYLDILLQMGWVGLAFYTFWLISCAHQLWQALAYDYDWASIGICFLIMGLAYNCTESALNSLSEQMTAMLVLTVLIVPCKGLVRRTTVRRWSLEGNAPDKKMGTDIRGGKSRLALR